MRPFTALCSIMIATHVRCHWLLLWLHVHFVQRMLDSGNMAWWSIGGSWKGEGRGCNTRWTGLSQASLALTTKVQNRIVSYPELKAVFSCPFRAQGEGAQLPAFPSGPVLTLDALRLPTGHEPTTPYHNEATRQCSLGNDWQSRHWIRKLGF